MELEVSCRPHFERTAAGIGNAGNPEASDESVSGDLNRSALLAFDPPIDRHPTLSDLHVHFRNRKRSAQGSLADEVSESRIVARHLTGCSGTVYHGSVEFLLEGLLQCQRHHEISAAGQIRAQCRRSQHRVVARHGDLDRHLDLGRVALGDQRLEIGDAHQRVGIAELLTHLRELFAPTDRRGGRIGCVGGCDRLKQHGASQEVR